MNALETWFCGSALWRYVTRRQLLPWLLQGADLGEHVLELGAGPGATTPELVRRAKRVTSLEYDHIFATRLAAATKSSSVRLIQGDAAALPFADHTFSSATAILMLHHLKSSELQDRAFSEIRRVLRPGGVFLAVEIPDSWINRVVHIKSTFVPMSPESARGRLAAAGFSSVKLNSRGGGLRFRATRSLGS